MNWRRTKCRLSAPMRSATAGLAAMISIAPMPISAAIAARVQRSTVHHQRPIDGGIGAGEAQLMRSPRRERLDERAEYARRAARNLSNWSHEAQAGDSSTTGAGALGASARGLAHGRIERAATREGTAPPRVAAKASAASPIR